LLLCLQDELRDAVLLVFANKQDLPNAMNAAEITDKLALHSLRQRHWYAVDGIHALECRVVAAFTFKCLCSCLGGAMVCQSAPGFGDAVDGLPAFYCHGLDYL
jgi:hypothetical protein